MKKAFLYLSVTAFLLLAGCAGKSQKQNTRVKVLNAMPSNIEMKYSPKRSDVNDENIQLKQNEVTAYRELPPGRYKISVASKGDELLKKTFGLAGGEKYTQIIYGKPSFSSRKNEETFTHKMHYIFEGSENYTKNGFLPGAMIFRDQIKLKKGSTSVRVFHAAAGLTSINLKLREGKNSTKIASKLTYAKPVLSNLLKSGEKTIEVYLGNAPKPFIEKKFEFQSKKAYIIVLLNENGKPIIKILEN